MSTKKGKPKPRLTLREDGLITVIAPDGYVLTRHGKRIIRQNAVCLRLEKIEEADGDG